MTYDITKIRSDFPILAREVYGKPLVYLDNAASAQKPKAVLVAAFEDLATETTKKEAVREERFQMAEARILP